MAEAIQDDVAERKALMAGTIPERAAYVEARREAASERDAARFRLASEQGELAISDDDGFAVVEPGPLDDLTAPIVSHADEVIESIGHDALFDRGSKGGFMARGFLPGDAFELASPYLRFALSERVVLPIANYLGVVPVLAKFDVWYSAHHPEEPKSSQLWHLDLDDVTQMKVWVHVNAVTEENGPLTVLRADASARLAEATDYNFGDAYRLPDDQVPAQGLVELTGPAGTVDFTDTSRCFHFGSRIPAGAAPRRVAMFQYLTPYSFKFGDHREQAKYRQLAAQTDSELEQLVLGAA